MHAFTTKGHPRPYVEVCFNNTCRIRVAYDAECYFWTPNLYTVFWTYVSPGLSCVLGK